MVGEIPRDHLGLRRVAGELVVLARQLEGGLDRFAAAAREEDAFEPGWGEPRDTSGELDRRRVRRRPRRVEAEVLRLVGASLRDVGASVTDVDAEERAQPIEVAFALGIPE